MPKRLIIYFLRSVITISNVLLFFTENNMNNIHMNSIILYYIHITYYFFTDLYSGLVIGLVVLGILVKD